jgi:hypothetical protein
MVPNVSRALSSTFSTVLLHSEGSISLPDTCSYSTQVWQKWNDTVPIQLALMDLGGPWRRMYSSDEDGLSFRPFQQALTSFYGPTLTLIRTRKGDTLGYFTEIPWKTSPNWFTGEGDSFLFRLHPRWNVYKASETVFPKKCHQFLNLPISHRKDSLVGLAVGGIAPDLPRFHIKLELENCKASPFGSIFDSGAPFGER